MLGAEAHDRGHVRGAARKDDDVGGMPPLEGVGAVDRPGLVVGADECGTDRGLELAEDVGGWGQRARSHLERPSKSLSPPSTRSAQNANKWFVSAVLGELRGEKLFAVPSLTP
jgi:hypothetical protein